MKKRTFASELELSRISIENALDNNSILKKLALYNYDRKALQQGNVLRQKVQMLESSRKGKYGLQYESTDSMYSQRSEILALYRRHIRRAKLAFEGNRGIQEQLGMLGKRKTDVSGLLIQVQTFYSNINQFAEGMNRYDVSTEELAQTQAMVEALFAARKTQQHCMGEAQDATHKRNVKRQELRMWMRQYHKIARIALADEPQMLEALGIVVPTQKV